MNRDNERQSAIILSVIGIIPVVWLALLIAPSVKGGFPFICKGCRCFYQHVLSTLKVVSKKIEPPPALEIQGLKAVSINTFCPIGLYE